MNLTKLGFKEMKRLREIKKQAEAQIKDELGVDLNMSFYDNKAPKDSIPHIEALKVSNVAFAAIEEVLGVTKAQMISKVRKREYVCARWFFSMYMSEKTLLTLSEIAFLIERTEHSTIVHAKQELEDQYDADKLLRTQYHLFTDAANLKLAGIQTKMIDTVKFDEVASLNDEILRVSNAIADAASMETKTALLDKKRELQQKLEDLTK